jgi:hypothetical protein
LELFGVSLFKDEAARKKPAADSILRHGRNSITEE